MKEIWKHQVEVIDTIVLKLRKGAKILSAQVQRNEICIWESHEVTQQTLEERTIRLIGTGHQYNESGLEYISTVIQGPFVWHIFEKLKEK